MKIEKMTLCCMLVLLTIITSCKKQIGETPVLIPCADTSQNKNRIADALKEVAEILEKVYQDNKALAEAVTAINCNYYYDERVLLKDLLFPSASGLYRNNLFRTNNVDTG